MLDIDLEEELVRKVGGKFALTSLLQKRMVELNRGERPLIEMEGEDIDKRRIACREILEDKICLASRDELETEEPEEGKRIESEPEAEEAPKEAEREIYGSDIKRLKEQRIKELSELLNPNKG